MTPSRFARGSTAPARTPPSAIAPAGFEGFARATGIPARPGEPAPPLGEGELERIGEAAARFNIRFPDPVGG